ncbi:hypothetical protein BMS3Bbin14_00116 [bacterium BMS3Bbin14]|nr:hypothetical protein BMS3Abin13_00595 [bacterium BMS3Abin13]GBE51662.1 hypothetical protein BMS3Bbin14_00116 [bacterium BMS3Bbin14]
MQYLEFIALLSNRHIFWSLPRRTAVRPITHFILSCRHELCRIYPPISCIFLLLRHDEEFIKVTDRSDQRGSRMRCSLARSWLGR